MSEQMSEQMSDQIYVLTCDGASFEDIQIFLSIYDATSALNKIKNNLDNFRIEIFVKKNNVYVPSYQTILQTI